MAKTILASAALGIASVAVVVVLSLTVLLLRIRPTLPSMAQIAAFQPASATTIWSSDGVLLAKLQMENRKPVSLKDVSAQLVDATLAVEDNRFYEHKGIDFHGIGRALFANITARDIRSQGGSTITQQLARNVSQFGISREKSLSRKLREAMTAVRIEQVFDKDTILELYLNQIYYGSGAYGVEAASRTYFGKPASKLDLAESALLAGLPQRPVAYSPYSDRNAARHRRDVVLKRMLDTGRITTSEYERAKSRPIRLANRHASHSVYRAPYFVDWVVQELVRRHGVDAVYSGWRVNTTLDWRMQERAEKALRRGLRYGASQGALVSVDPHSGEVRAMVGGVDYRKDQFNAVTQGKRQPGSAFKPIVYAAAFDCGALSLYSEMKDERLDIPTERKTWIVHNFGGGYRNKDVTMLEAITSSINTVAVQAAQEAGLPRVISTAQQMGITTELAPYLPLALGASAVRPIELCSAYGVFAAEGTRYAPAGLRLITDSAGRVVYQRNAEESRNSSVLSSGTVEQINVALRSVVTSGTGAATSNVPNAFGKTGTTNDGRDAWFVGYTPELVTAVWVANPRKDSRGITHYAVMPGATGGHVAAPIWADFMQGAVKVQSAANRLRRMPRYAIHVPPPQTPEVILALDDLPDSPDGAQFANHIEAANLPNASSLGPDVSPDSDEGWVERDRAAPAENRAYLSGGEVGYASAAPASPGGAQTADIRSNRTPARRGASLVRICAETGRLATEWCDTTILIDASTRITPTLICRRHHAPFGEPQR